MEDVFGKDTLTNFFENQTTVSLPAVNVLENKDGFRVEIAVPGMDKSDYKLDINHNCLTISSEKKTATLESDEKYLRREFSLHTFRRSINLPDTVDTDKIKANQNNGILTIFIPKKDEEKVKSKREIIID